MPRIELLDQAIVTEFTADAAVADEELVAITGANAVSPASDTEVQETVGVADADAAAGEPVGVVIFGKKQVTADGAINPGEPVVPAATAGRAVSEAANSADHSHPIPDHDHPVADHSHTIDDHSHTIATHTHTVPDHVHTMPTHAHTALQTDGTDEAPAAHQGMLAGDGGTVPGHVGVAASGQAAETVPTSSDDPGDTNSGGPGSTDADGTGSTDAGGSGSTNTGGPGSTDLGGPGSTDAATTSADNARSVAIAVGSTAAAGETLDVLVGVKSG